MLGRLDTLLEMQPAPGLSGVKKAAFHVIQGTALLEANVLRQARAKFEAALSFESDNPAAYRGIALANIRQGRSDAALRAAEHALKLDLTEAESWYVRGEVRRSRRELKRALEDFEEASRSRPTHAPAILGRAALMLDMGRLEEAHVLLLEFNELAPDELQGLFLLSQVQIALGDSIGADQTLEHAREVLNQIPPEVAQENLPALMVSAVIALRDNLPQQARDLL